MSKSSAFENDLLKAIFNSSNIANLLDNAGSSPLTNLYIALHSSDPGDAGNQSTNEISYTGYARVAVARDTTGFTVTGSVVNPKNNINFGICTAGTTTATYWSVGKLGSGAGQILYSGTITPSIAISTTVTPVLVPQTSITED